MEKALTVRCTCVCGCRQPAEKEDNLCRDCKADGPPPATDESHAGGQQVPRVANIMDALKESVAKAKAAQIAKGNQSPSEVARDIPRGVQRPKLEQPLVEDDIVGGPDERREGGDGSSEVRAPPGVLLSMPKEDTVARNTKRVLHDLREYWDVYLFLFVLFAPGVIGVAATIFYLFGGDSAWLVP